MRCANSWVYNFTRCMYVGMLNSRHADGVDLIEDSSCYVLYNIYIVPDITDT